MRDMKRYLDEVLIELKNIITATTSIAHVKNDLTVYGPLLAQKSTFKGPLRLFTSEMCLKDCQAHSIIIEKDKTYFADSPRVHLVGETKVFGNIEFKGKKGIVEVGPEVKIEGKIINGIIQDKKK